MLSMAIVALHAQEAVFQGTAFETGFEFALDIARQNRALLCKVCRKLRIVTFNDLVKQGVFGLVALIVIRARFLVAASCRNARRHELHPCETVVYIVYRPNASKRKAGPLLYTSAIFNMTPSPGGTSCLENAEIDLRIIVEYLEASIDEEAFKKELLGEDHKHTDSDFTGRFLSGDDVT